MAGFGILFAVGRWRPLVLCRTGGGREEDCVLGFPVWFLYWIPLQSIEKLPSGSSILLKKDYRGTNEKTPSTAIFVGGLGLENPSSGLPPPPGLYQLYIRCHGSCGDHQVIYV